MLKFSRFLKKLTDAAIVAALQTLLVALGGAVVTAIVAVWSYMRGTPVRWTDRAVGAFVAFVAFFLATAIVVFVRSRRLKIMEHLRDAQFSSGEKGFLDFLMDRQKAEKELVKIVGSIIQETERIGKKVREHTRKVETIAKYPEPKRIVKSHRLASATAKDFRKCSRKLEKLLSLFDKTTELLGESHIGYMKWFTLSTEEEKLQLVIFHNAIKELLNTVRETLKSQEGWRDKVRGLTGISQELNAAAARLAATIDSIIDVQKKNEQWCITVSNMIEGKLRGDDLSG